MVYVVREHCVRHYQLTRCMIPDRTVWSLFEVTIKLFKVAPNELSKMDDHSGLRSVTKFPIGPTGLSLNACSCWIALRRIGIPSGKPESLLSPSLLRLCNSDSISLTSRLACATGGFALLSWSSAAFISSYIRFAFC